MEKVIPAADVVRLGKAMEKFNAEYGAALVQWGIIEQRLCFWFVYLTGMPEAMARSVFYDATNSFSARNQLLRCITETATITDGLRKCLTTILNKAHAYSSTRNALSHCETKWDLDPRSPTYCQVILAEGSQPLAEMKATLTIEKLPIIRENFKEFGRLIMDVHEDVHLHTEASFRTFREQVHVLPLKADETQANPHPLKD